jgi:hypothetical protein
METLALVIGIAFIVIVGSAVFVLILDLVDGGKNNNQ